MTSYNYSIQNDTANSKLNIDDLDFEIRNSSITVALDSISSSSDNLAINFKLSLSASEETELNTLVSNHQGSGYTARTIPVDSSNREIVRYAITQEGWAFLAHFIEGTTSKLNSIYCQDYQGNEETQHYCKFYDSNGTELTTQQDIDNSCVKSVFTIKPEIDYEIVSGEIHQYVKPTTNVRLNTVIGAVDNNGDLLSGVDFVRNLNLKFKDTNKAIVTDGRTARMLVKETSGVPFDTNQIQIIIYHDAGIQHDFMVELEYYRE